MDRSGGLVSTVFSWSLEDILNDYLYRDKVKQIPRTFSSGRYYLNSFILPLIEETRTDLCSSIKEISEAPACEINYFNVAEGYNPPHDLLYTIEIKTMLDGDKKGDAYEPETGDIITFTDMIPTCIDVLNKPGNSYRIALVRRVQQDFDQKVYMVEILASKPINFEQYMQEDGRYIYGFAVYLSNITTNRRIWNALNTDPEGPDMYIIKQLLQPNYAAAENCSQCFSSERRTIDTSTLGAVIRSFDLNKPQEEGVLSCLAARECSHRNNVKLIWGPPGTGKTKTVGSLLFALFRRKCKTLTCAPTNVAVMEVTSRLLSLVAESLDYQICGLGDIILFGNRERMKIDTRDDLMDVFLDYRAKILCECFAPLSGWKHNLQQMIWLLENPKLQYCEYLKSDEKGSYEADGNDCLKKEIELLASQQTNQEKKGIYSQSPRICIQNEWKRIVDKTLWQ